MGIYRVRHLYLYIFSLSLLNAVAGDLPQQVEMSMQSAEKLGFKFETEIMSGEQSTLVYFPAEISNCHAGRVQTLLSDSSGS